MSVFAIWKTQGNMCKGDMPFALKMLDLKIKNPTKTIYKKSKKALQYKS